MWSKSGVEKMCSNCMTPSTFLKFMNCINAFLDSYFPVEFNQLKDQQEMRGRKGSGEVGVFISSYFLARSPKIGHIPLPECDCSCNNNYFSGVRRAPACKWLHGASPHCFCLLLMHNEFLCRWEVNICVTPLKWSCTLSHLICEKSLPV